MTNLEAVFIEVQSHYDRHLPFVIYKKPNDNIVTAFLVKHKELDYLTSSEQQGFVISPFRYPDKSIVFSLEASKVIKAKLNLPNNNLYDSAIHHLEHVDRNYINLVTSCIDDIRTTALEKVVISRKRVINNVQRSPIDIFNQLITSYPLAFNYVWYHPKIGVWLGATPEYLLEIKDNTFRTMALAGTKNFDDEWTIKEEKEQDYVVQYLKKVLKPFTNSINIHDRTTVTAGQVQHLRTMIDGTLNMDHIDVLKFITSLHPTPAVCGYPKKLAMDVILKKEGYDREFYCGFLGEFNMALQRKEMSATSSLFVNLRCMKMEGKQAHIFVGGGITEDSNPELEWEETVRKSQTLIRFLL